MAPRRHHSHGGAGEVQGLLGIDSHESNSPSMNSPPSSALGLGLTSLNGTMALESLIANTSGHNVTRCCVPTGECLRASAMNNGNANNNDYILISQDDLCDAVRVICNNDNCTMGEFMHLECFESWEQTVLTYLKSCGRARSWSERQRYQNLWTKKGYDLAFKACSCKCGRGHLKKDLDWNPPQHTCNGVFRSDDMDPAAAAAAKKKKRKNRNNTRPTLAISTHPQYHSNCNTQQTRDSPFMPTYTAAGPVGEMGRGRTGSLSSSTGSSSPPVSAASESSVSPAHCGAKKKSRFDFVSDRLRSSAGNGANGIFTRRMDFSSFNKLSRQKHNSYDIKMEDEGNHGNDETRCFILSTLAGINSPRVHCVLCNDEMLVFDRYPLVDGTFFLSPKEHNSRCIKVQQETRTLYLAAVCMACLEAKDASRAIYCFKCGKQWKGSSLVLGTMYSYDIFAATPCCNERSNCNNCCKPLLQFNQRLNYFSDYSRLVPCPHCSKADYHFVKPLAYCYTRERIQLYRQWP